MSQQLGFLIYFWASLSVDGTAGASITGNSRLGLNEQTLSLLYSFVSGNHWNLCSISFLAALVELYLTSINFNLINSTLNNFANSFLSVAKIIPETQRDFLEKRSNR